MDAILNVAIKAARRASKIVLQSFDNLTDLTVIEKTPRNFVTMVDRRSEETIIETIHHYYPEHRIFAEEESFNRDGDCRVTPDTEDTRPLWIIDPLDGTTNYVHGIPHFCISIAYLDKGKIQCGAIYDPIRNELFTAIRGKGAHLNSRRIRVSSCQRLSYALVGMGAFCHANQCAPTALHIAEMLMPKILGFRRTGSAALDLAYVASGRLDAFWEFSLKPWDVAAGGLLIQEAGGLICDPGRKQRYLHTGNVVAATPALHRQMMNTILPYLPEDLK